MLRLECGVESCKDQRAGYSHDAFRRATLNRADLKKLVTKMMYAHAQRRLHRACQPLASLRPFDIDRLIPYPFPACASTPHSQCGGVTAPTTDESRRETDVDPPCVMRHLRS